MKIVFLGTPQFAVPTLEVLLDRAEFEVVAVVTQPDKPRGRGKQLIPSPVKKIASDRHIPVWQPKRIKKHSETLENLAQANADVFVVVAYGQILSQAILDVPKLGCINVHGSILPEYRGAAPIQWCLYHGKSATGITTMLMDAGMDTGAMLLKAIAEIPLLENARQLAARLATMGSELLAETLLQLDAGTLGPEPQDGDRATYAPPIQKSDFALDWSRPAIALHNQIRAFYPNCVATLRSQALKIIATVPLGEAYQPQLPPEYSAIAPIPIASDTPGEVVGIIKKFGPVVQTGEGQLLVTEAQLAGKRAQSGWDFANGTRLAVGEMFGNGERSE